MSTCTFDNFLCIDEDTIIRAVSNLFMGIGIMPSLKGYSYLIRSAYFCFRSEGKYSLTKDIYPKTGEFFSTSPHSVERNMRSAVEKACNSGAMLRLDAYMENTVVPKDGYITTGQLLAYTREYLLKKLVYQNPSYAA